MITKQMRKLAPILVLLVIIIITSFVIVSRKTEVKKAPTSVGTADIKVDKKTLEDNEFIDKVKDIDNDWYEISSEKIGITLNVPKTNITFDNFDKAAGYNNLDHLTFCVKGGGCATFYSYPLNKYSNFKDLRGSAISAMKSALKPDEKQKPGTRALLISDFKEFVQDGKKGYQFGIHEVNANSQKFWHNEFTNFYEYYLSSNKDHVLVITETYFSEYSYEDSPDSINTMTDIISSIKFINK